MTNANMKIVTLDVPFQGELELSPQSLDPGEFIKVRIVELSKLRTELIGKWSLAPFIGLTANFTVLHVQSMGRRYSKCITMGTRWPAQ